MTWLEWLHSLPEQDRTDPHTLIAAIINALEIAGIPPPKPNEETK